MKKVLKKYFIPYKENNYKPHFLREWGVLTLASILVILFLATAFFQYNLATRSNFLAAVISSVVVDLTNDDRADEDLITLVKNDLLVEAAQLKADDMADESYFAHTSPEGLNPWHWFREVGYEFQSAGENLAVHFSDSKEVQKAWMNSPTHRANILSEKYTEIGVATAEGAYEGKKTTFVVQMFGRPASLPTEPVVVTDVVPEVTPEETGTVLGEEAEAIKESIEIQHVVTEATTSEDNTESFIAIAQRPEALVENETSVERYATTSERIITSPTSMFRTILAVVAGLVMIALISMIVVEVRRRHIKHIFYGVMLLSVIAFLFFLSYQHIFIPGVLIA